MRVAYRAAIEIRPLDEGGKTGAAAYRGSERVGFMLGLLGPARNRDPHAWVALGDHSADDPDLYGAVYAAAGQRWVDAGHLTHVVVVPAADDVLAVFFELGFGKEQVHAEAPARPEPPRRTEGFRIRRAGLDDLEAELSLAGLISEHLQGAPVWSGHPAPPPEERRRSWEEFLAEEGTVHLLAERAGRSVGHASVYVEEGTAYLAVAAARPGERGLGIGRALVEHALHAAHALGHATLKTDWRSTNLLAWRFFPRRGFRPFAFRLRRDVQPPVAG